jgi:flagellar biosynthesis/type III secretory pathway M-ring protein FliF/YscJ
MLGKSGNLNPGAGPSSRALALAAFVIALGLIAWRGNALLTTDNPLSATATPLEASLMNIIEPVAGRGNARISVNMSADGGRTVLVLLDAAATAQASTVESLVSAAARLDVLAGDLLVMQQVTFAKGAPGRPDAAAYGELSFLALLAGLLGWLAFAPRDDVVVETVEEAPPRTLAPTHDRPLTPTPVRAVRAPFPSSDAVELARKDPARAAEILRGWMNNRTDAA